MSGVNEPVRSGRAHSTEAGAANGAHALARGAGQGRADGSEDARKPRSLFWAIAAAFLLAVLLGTLAQSLVAVAVLRPLEMRELRTRAQLATSRLAAELAALPGPVDSARVVALIQRVRAEAELRAPILYRGPNGQVLADRPEFARRLLAGLEHPETATPPDARRGEHFQLSVLATRPVGRAGAPAGQVMVLYALRPDRSPWAWRPDALLLSLPIALIGSLVAALIMVRLLVRRLRALERFAQRVAADDLSARVEDTRRDEIGRLAAQFNQMAERMASARDRLAEEERQRRQLFADITHELATPLTSIRGYTETLLDPRVRLSDEDRTRYLGNTLEESRRLDRLIRDLFDLARLEAGAAPLEPEPLDWMALCRNVTQRFEPRFAQAGLTLAWGMAPAEAWIEADGHRIEQVVENLLNNALRYVPPGGTVELSMAPQPAANGARRFRLTVSDDGPGAPPEEMARLFQRFYRGGGRKGSADADGSGLGLAIVREIVQRHAGTATASAREPRGLSIAIELPGAG